MKTIHSNWNRLGISRKFNLAFSLLLCLILLTAATAYISFLSIRNAEEDIRKSTAIGKQVLEMDRGMEKSRRLLGHFFLHHHSLGLQKAHEQYAQPAIRQISQVVSQSSDLEKTLFQSELETISSISQMDVNLYLASARRFADTSIEAVELLSKRVAPQRGVEAQITLMGGKFRKELQEFPRLENLFTRVFSFIRKYQISRQRFLMQSALNSLDTLHHAVEQEAGLQADQKNEILRLMDSTRSLANEMLALDHGIAGKMRDFSLQEQTIAPVSNALITAAEDEVQQAQQRIDQIYRLAGIIILSITLLAILAMTTIAKLLSHTITGNILSLTHSAKEFGKGNLDIRASEDSQDELGQLARIFNTMAAQVQDLVGNLEQKVIQRTAELSESEERFRTLVTDLPKIAVQGYDTERNVVYWNRASEMFYGYDEKEAMGKKLEDLIIPAPMKEGVIQAIRNWYQNGVTIPSSELTLRHKDGSDVAVYSSHVMQISSQGEKTMYCVDLDLADLKLAQAMEQKIESFYRQLFDHSSSGVAVYEAVDNGQDFIFKDFNKAGEKIEGLSRESLLGRRMTEAFPSVEEFGMLAVFRQVWKTGEPAFHPVSCYKDERLQGWRENRVYKLPTGEVVAVYDDITKEKQLEEEKQAVEMRLQRAQKMEAIGLMAGGVAHDLNNILTGVTGYPELLLLQLPADSELRTPIETIKESGERAAAVVADLLTVARGVASTRVSANMNTLVSEYLDSPEWHHLHTLHQHIQYHKTLSKDLPNISCSPVHIKKCIMNLVTNAAEAIDTSGTITLSTTSITPDLQWAKKHGLQQMEHIVLTITDTGTGIPKENIDRIFEPFYTKKVMGRSGTGLGLAVVWNTVEDHAGKIIVESSDKGTRFQLYFPVSKKDKDDVAAIKQDKAEELTGSNEYLLVVDDEPVLRDIACQMLQNLGYTVDSVSSGEQAIKFIQKNTVDLILIDMLMEPGMNGRATYEEILKISPAQKALIVSGYSESDEVKAALKLGAGGFIKKPYSMDQLARVVKKALHSSLERK